jgi:type IV secretion system protein VirD4
MGRLERWRLLNRWHRGFLIDGRHGRLGLTPSLQSCVTVAGQGAGKSSACVIPNLLTLDGCSLVITDTKGSVYQQTSGDLVQRGLAIKVLNLMEPTRSHPYNPLARLHTPLQVLKAIDLIYAARGGRSADPFWDDGAKRLLRILAQCLINRGDPAQATLANIKHLLDQFDAHRRDGSRLDRFVVESTLDDPQTFADYRGLVGATPERTLLSFVTEAAAALRLLASPEIAALLAGDGFDFAALRQRKTALYILVRQQDMESYGFILNLFVRDLFDALLGQLGPGLPVFMLLDEFGHLQVPNFEIYATTAREYRVAFWLFLQSFGQLEQRYGKAGAQIILDGIGSRSVFGGLGLDTAERISRELGLVRHRNGRDEPLMQAAAVRGLEADTMLWLHHNLAPALLKMTPFFRHREFKKRAALPAQPLPVLDAAVSLVELDGAQPQEPEPEAPPTDDVDQRAARDDIAAVLAPPAPEGPQAP